MPQSLAQVYLHLIFSTKNRIPYFQNQDEREGIFAFVAGICQRRDCFAKQVGGYIDHLHILCSLSRTITIADLVKEIKTTATEWAKNTLTDARDFHWQSGYAVFSVSQSQLEKTRLYILSQNEHHRQKSFQDELREFLARYQTAFDERYVWD